MRKLFALFTSGLIMLGSMLFGILLGMIPIGVALGIFLVSRWLPMVMVSVPEVTGLLTVNYFTGELKAYGTKLHFRYPWEQVKMKEKNNNFINLRLITKNMKGSYPSKKGTPVYVEWSYQYVATIPGLPRYIVVDDTTIEGGFSDVGSSTLGEKISQHDPEEIVNTDRKELERDLQLGFENPNSLCSKIGIPDCSLESYYGVDLVKVAIAIVTYEPEYGEVLTAKAVADQIKEIATKLKEGTDISYKDAHNEALIINHKVTKVIQEVEGEGLQALAGLIMAAANARGQKDKGGKK